MRKRVLICTLIILSFISMSCICAVDVNDDAVASQNSTAIDLTQIDENDEISLPDESQVVGQTDDQEMISADVKGTFAELESEIQNGYGSTITLGRNYEYEGTGYSDGITINNPITIDGKGHIIDAKGKARIFDIKSDNVIIKNVIFMNGKVGQNKGGAVYWGGMQGTVSGCEFVGNYLTDEESFTSSGNAIYNTGNFFFF